MSIDTLLDGLGQAKQTGHGRWIAQCPSHDDRTPSLSVRQTDDGKILLHCFAGCDVGDILTSLGLTIEDLFTDGPKWHKSERELRPFTTADALRGIAHEAVYVAVAAAQIRSGRKLSKADHDRLTLAASRINHALEVCHV